MLADAYHMQRVLKQGWGDGVAGWKAGATSREVQALLGINEPVFGPVFEQTVFASPAGEIVLTGTTTGLHAPDPRQPAVADFGPLGSVELVFG